MEASLTLKVDFRSGVLSVWVEVRLHDGQACNKLDLHFQITLNAKRTSHISGLKCELINMQK